MKHRESRSSSRKEQKRKVRAARLVRGSRDAKSTSSFSKVMLKLCRPVRAATPAMDPSRTAVSLSA
jgi:hypothetical protein